MKVEQALRLLPDLEALAPLRARVLAASRTDEATAWAGAGPYLTVGRRELAPAELRRRVAQTFHLVTDHLSGLYDAYVDALDSLEHDDPAGAVSALLRAGRREQGVGRGPQAGAWLDVALSLASGLPDRRPEIQALLALGQLDVGQGRLEAGARHCQRALALAEAEFDQAGATAASRLLGSAALERGEWAGARAWYARAMRLAEAAGDPRRMGEIQQCFGEAARRRGDVAAAREHLRTARELFERAGEARQIAAVLNSQGLLETAAADYPAAAAAYREALAWSRRGERDPRFQVECRVNLAALQLDAGRLLEAESELRRAEQLAINGDLLAELVVIYLRLGDLHGRQGDDTGFVFFEQAIELVHQIGSPARLEADAYQAYGEFKRRVGQADEARAYLERAEGIYRAAGLPDGDGPGIPRAGEQSA